MCDFGFVGHFASGGSCDTCEACRQTYGGKGTLTNLCTHSVRELTPSVRMAITILHKVKVPHSLSALGVSEVKSVGFCAPNCSLLSFQPQ